MQTTPSSFATRRAKPWWVPGGGVELSFPLEDQKGAAEPDVREAMSLGGDLVLDQHCVHSASAVSPAKWAQEKGLPLSCWCQRSPGIQQRPSW